MLDQLLKAVANQLGNQIPGGLDLVGVGLKPGQVLATPAAEMALNTPRNYAGPEEAILFARKI